MGNKQTAVDWIYNMLHNEEVIIYHGLFELWYKQAKAMEKEQISNGYYQGLIDGMNNSPRQYYEETYGK